MYPVKGSCWPSHFNILRECRSIFNGRLIVVCSMDHRTDPFDLVRSEWSDPDIQWREESNDPHLGESKIFLSVLDELKSSRVDEATFYAHSKGVTHKLDNRNVHAWTEAMFFMCLKDIGLVEKVLSRYSCYGCFLHEVNHQGSSWHYPGTFFWFKHSSLFSRDWKRIVLNRFGVEAYLGSVLPVTEAFNCTPKPNKNCVDLYFGPSVTEMECRRWMNDCHIC